MQEDEESLSNEFGVLILTDDPALNSLEWEVLREMELLLASSVIRLTDCVGSLARVCVFSNEFNFQL